MNQIFTIFKFHPSRGVIYCGVNGTNIEIDDMINLNGLIEQTPYVHDRFKFSSRRHIIQVIKRHYPNTRILDAKR